MLPVAHCLWAHLALVFHKNWKENRDAPQTRVVSLEIQTLSPPPESRARGPLLFVPWKTAIKSVAFGVSQAGWNQPNRSKAQFIMCETGMITNDPKRYFGDYLRQAGRP